LFLNVFFVVKSRNRCHENSSVWAGCGRESSGRF
jgi:hypothetical protein